MHAPLVIHARMWRPSMAMSYSTACSFSINVTRRDTVTFTLHRCASSRRAAATARPGCSYDIVSPSIRITYAVVTL